MKNLKSFFEKKKMTYILQPKYFISGMIIGFIACCIAGHIVSKKSRFHHFRRFSYANSPQMLYYPVAHEVLATAKHELHHDKIPVLIGGNSIMRGYGQNLDELWSDELQRILGDDFEVLNYAMDGSSFTSFGAVAFRMLKEQYPKMLFVTTSFPDSIDANRMRDGIYAYFFWDAFYKGLFHPDAAELKIIHKIRNQQIMTTEGLERHLLAWLDSFFYFRNFWNWFVYHIFFTTWTDFYSDHPFKRRCADKEKNYLFDQIIRALLKNTKQIKVDAQIFFDQYISNYSGPDTYIKMQEKYNDAFAFYYRKNILCLVIKENPAYITAISQTLQIKHNTIMNTYGYLTSQLGYHTIFAGRGYLAEDFVDGHHLSASGGKKLAAEIAKEVKKMVKDQGI